MPFAIALVALKYPEYHLLFFLLVVTASLANDGFFYLGGRFGRTRWAPLFPRLFSAGRLAAAERYFSRFGLLAFLSGRFIPFGAGNSVVASAGLARLPLPRFLAYTLVSCLTYALVYFYGTFLFGPALFRGPGGLVILALLVTILAITMIASRRTPDTSAPVSRPATPLGDGLS